MKYFIVVAALLVAPLLATTPAAAQVGAFSESAAATSFAPAADSASWDGSVSGSPLNGSIHVDESRGPGGSMQGQFTLVDPGGSTITGSLGGSFSMAPSGSSASGSYTISGGTGAFT